MANFKVEGDVTIFEKTSRKEAKAKGMKSFYTGIICNHGHIADRSVKYGTCRECNSIKQLKFHKNKSTKREKTMVSERKLYRVYFTKKATGRNIYTIERALSAEAAIENVKIIYGADVIIAKVKVKDGMSWKLISI